jgi:two-component system, OmpR family, response regulator VicR
MSKKVILVVEDDRTIRKMLEIRLSREGFEIVTAKDGKEAIEKLEQSLPDLVVTDLMMPFRSGLEVVEFIKNKDKNIPVLVLSSAGHEKTVQDAFQLGADDFINKPFNPVELILRIKRYCK